MLIHMMNYQRFALCLRLPNVNASSVSPGEAVREAWRARRFTMDDMDRYARICRVERVIRPYREALVG